MFQMLKQLICAFYLPSIEAATIEAKRRIKAVGLWDDRMEKITVRRAFFGICQGWQNYGTDGAVVIPYFSLSRIHYSWRNQFDLVSLLCHELAHAFDYTHRGLVRSRRFRRAFGLSIDNPSAFYYDPYFHVSEYAATCSSEDFAEVFAEYVMNNGSVPDGFPEGALPKWRFMDSLAKAVASGQKRFR